MKKLLFLFLPIFVFAMPNWFFNIEPKDQNEIIGFGVAPTLEEAKKQAIADITQKISIHVRSSTNVSVSDNNGDVLQNSSTDLNTSSEAALSGIEFIKIDNFVGDWYVAATYDNASIEVKLKKRLSENHINNEKQNNYLAHTPLIKSINKYTQQKLNYKLVRKDKLWQLNYKDIFIPLKQDEFYKLFTSINNKFISIQANKKTYRQNDEMYFELSQETQGYISILYVEHNGKVGVLLSNHFSSKPFTFPDPKSQDIFHIANPYENTIQELYIALYSPTKIDLNHFENVSDKALDESNYNFDKIISKMDTNHFSTFLIKVKAP